MVNNDALMNKKSLFETIIKKVETIYNDKEKAEVLSHIAIRIVKSDVEDKILLFDKLLEEAKILKDDFYKCDIIKDITAEMIYIKDIDKESIFDKIIDYANYIYDEDRANAFICIAEELAKNEVANKVRLFDKVIECSKSIHNDAYKANAFIVISTKLATIKLNTCCSDKVSLFNNIIDIVEDINDIYKSNIFSKLVKVLVENNIDGMSLFEKIISGIQKIASSKVKAEVLDNIICELSYIKMSNKDILNEQQIVCKIIETIKNIYSDKSKSELYGTIVKKLISEMQNDKKIAKTFLFKEIIKNAKEIKNLYHKANAFEDIVTVLSKNGNFEEAISLIEEIDSDRYKSFAINKIADKL